VPAAWAVGKKECPALRARKSQGTFDGIYEKVGQPLDDPLTLALLFDLGYCARVFASTQLCAHNNRLARQRGNRIAPLCAKVGIGGQKDLRHYFFGPVGRPARPRRGKEKGTVAHRQAVCAHFVRCEKTTEAASPFCPLLARLPKSMPRPIETDQWESRTASKKWPKEK
jgi:hypothetical protein